MPHLLLDASYARWHTLPTKRLHTHLLAGKKKRKHFLRQAEGAAVSCGKLPEKARQAAVLLRKTALDILQDNPRATIILVSARCKLKNTAAELQAAYPQADILRAKKIGRKVRRFIKTALAAAEQTAEFVPSVSAARAEPLVTEAAGHVQAAVAHVLAAADSTPAAPAEQSDNKQPEKQQQPSEHDDTLAAALVLLKKNKPKKKTDLLRLLSARFPEQAETLLARLQQHHHIRIDAAENVRYR